MASQKNIPKQIRLSLNVAFGVVIQGIRIRFGRSLVTLSGVIFGIAFLMSILTGQLLKQGVQGEEEARSQLNRMKGFLTASTGPLQDKKLTIAAAGELSRLDLRFLRILADENAGVLEWIDDVLSPIDRSVLHKSVQSVLTPVSLSQAGEESSALVLLGDSAALLDASGGKVDDLLKRTRQRVIAVGENFEPGSVPAGMNADVVDLHPPERPEEAAARRAAERRENFRFVWILAISALVTIIGIANAMLMSVTERFREIGTMKCLGALSGFIRHIFLLESSLLGLVGSIIGALGGALFSMLVYGISYGMGTALGSLNVLHLLAGFGISIIAGILFSVVAALYPARVASRMVPAVALRSNV